MIDGNDSLLYCDAENFEILLRWQRAANRPEFEALSVRQLPSVLANWHRFNRQCNEQSILDTVDQLRGYSTYIQALLVDCFAARLTDFSDHQLDSTFSQQQLSWAGNGKGQCYLSYPEDIELLHESASAAKKPAGKSKSTVLHSSVDSGHSLLASCFNDVNARYSFLQISDQLRQQNGSIDAAQSNELWWESVWAGRITADSLTPLRQGHARNYLLSLIHI